VTRRAWTGAERLRLLRLAGTLPTAALAERFGRTRKAIENQVSLLRKHGTTRPGPKSAPNPQGRTAAARALAAEIAAARAERATAPLYRGGPLLW
jgi:transposase-like protein